MWQDNRMIKKVINQITEERAKERTKQKQIIMSKRA